MLQNLYITEHIVVLRGVGAACRGEGLVEGKGLSRGRACRGEGLVEVNIVCQGVTGWGLTEGG